MNFRRRKNSHASVETGALSDILFFLMLFFLIVSTLASPTAIKLLLPKSETGQTVPKQLINVSVNAAGELFVETAPTNIQNLQTTLAAKSAGAENPTVVLRVDKSLSVEKLVEVVDIVNKAKIPLVIATDKKN